MLAAVRERLRLGASQIKLATTGGISSDSDPLDSLQFTFDEIRAAVEAASDWGTSVTVHNYSSGRRGARAIDAGVKVIDHGQLLDEPTIKLIAELRRPHLTCPPQEPQWGRRTAPPTFPTNPAREYNRHRVRQRDDYGNYESRCCVPQPTPDSLHA